MTGVTRYPAPHKYGRVRTFLSEIIRAIIMRVSYNTNLLFFNRRPSGLNANQANTLDH